MDTPGPTVNYYSLLEQHKGRSQYLAKLIQIINGTFLTIFIAFFTVSLSSNGDVKNLIVCISILFFWRFYIHLVDLEMVDVYGRIIYCEEKLGFFEDQISLKGSLIRQQKNEIIFSNRGQLWFDLLAFLIMFGLGLNSLFSFNNEFPIPENGILAFFALFEIIFYVVYVYYITRKSKKLISKLLYS